MPIQTGKITSIRWFCFLVYKTFPVYGPLKSKKKHNPVIAKILKKNAEKLATLVFQPLTH